MKARRVAVIGAVAVTLILGACADNLPDDPGASPAPTVVGGGTLRIVVPATLGAGGLDPLRADPAALRVVSPAVLATLMRPDPAGGAPTPWLAESVDKDAAARVWTIALREGLTFDDGTPMSSADVAFMLREAATNTALGTRFGADAQGTYLQDVVTPDVRTIVVRLRKANVAFDRLVLAAPEFGCIKNEFGGADRSAYFVAPAACGPFSLNGAATGATLQLVRNARYVDAASVLPDAVEVAAGAQARATADVVLGSAAPRATEAVTSRVTPSAQTVGSVPGITTVLVFGQRAPASDANLRQALRAIVNPPSFARGAEGAIVPASGTTPPAWAGSVALGEAQPRPDIAALAVSLVPEAARTVALVVPRDDAALVERARVLAAAATGVGLTVNVDALEPQAYARATTQGRFAAALVRIAPTVAHAAELSRIWSITRGFGGGWSPAAGSAAYPVQIGRSSDPGRAASATARFEDTLQRNSWAVPLVIDPHQAVVSPGVTGVVVGTDGSLALERIGRQPVASATPGTGS